MVSIQEQVMMTRVRYLCAKEFSTLCSSVHTCLNLCKPNSFRLVQTGPNLFKLVQTYPNLSKLFRNKLNHSYIFFISGELTTSQFPVFTIYVQKNCLPSAAVCDAAWSFERVMDHQLASNPITRARRESRNDCMELCLTDDNCR